MKKTVKLFIAVALVLTLVAGSIVVSDIRDKEKTDVNAEEVIAEADTTVDADTEAVKADTKTTDVADAKTTGTTGATSATTEATTERPATTTERPAATTEAPASNHTHNWVKVVDRAAYDEPIYTEKPVYEERPVYETQTTYVDHLTWPDGTEADSSLHSGSNKLNWCYLHCTRCNPNCTDPDPRGFCALQIQFWTEEVTTRVQTGTEKVQVGTEKIQTGTKHHDEEYHYECTCGARK